MIVLLRNLFHEQRQAAQHSVRIAMQQERTGMQAGTGNGAVPIQIKSHATSAA